MDFSNDILQEISPTEIVAVKELYKKDWPFGIYTYNYLEVALHWKQEHGYSIQFFCPDGRYEDGTIITISEQDFFRVTCSTLDKSNARLLEALRKTRRVNWQKLPNFVYLHKDQTPLVLDTMFSHSLMPHFYHPGAYWWLPKETAAQFELIVPVGTYLGPLSVSHAAQIHAVWPHRDDMPRSFIRQLIEYNGGIGLFQVADGALSAWILRNDYGALAVLQTDVAYRGQGYAKVVTRALCKHVAAARSASDPFTIIVIGNVVSESLFRKLGFQVIDCLTWMGTKPTK